MRHALLVALLSLSSRADALCIAGGLAPHVLKPAGTVVSRDGGIVVAAYPEGGRLDPGDVAVQSMWRMRVGDDQIVPRIVTLAPGLAVYRVTIAAATEAKLEDDKHQVVVAVKLAHDGGEKLAAPNVKRLVYSVSHGRHGSTQVIAELAGAAPTGAIALVLADKGGVARSWGAGSGSSWTVLSSGGCQTIPNGTQLSNPGDQVTLFWVFADGRVSPATKPIAIGSK